MDNNQKIQIINKAFHLLDKPNSGMSDLSAPKGMNYFPILFYEGFDDKIMGDIKLSEVGGKINTGLILESSWWSFKNVKYQDVRGFCKFDPRNLIRVDNVAYTKNGKIGITNIYATSDFKTYHLLNKDKRVFNNPIKKSDRHDDRFATALSMACYFDFTKEYFDTIQVELNGTKITFPTTPNMSKEILKLRDVPEGKRRREMIVNWVSEHSREVNNKDVVVRKHLRGKESFSWLGYNVTIEKNI